MKVDGWPGSLIILLGIGLGSCGEPARLAVQVGGGSPGDARIEETDLAVAGAPDTSPDPSAPIDATDGTVHDDVQPPSARSTCGQEPADRAFLYFQIPRATDAPDENDFYRLPFPNDIRKHAGRIQLAGHPRSGIRLGNFDPVESILQTIEADAKGFGTNQAVYLRFSRDPDLASLKTAGAIALLDITPATPEYGQLQSIDWSANMARTAYLCPRYLVVRPTFGKPLRPGKTYAAIVRTWVRDRGGNSFGMDEDFAAMLGSTAPDNAELAAAWTAYEPLRRYLADASAPLKILQSELAVAAVFTTEKVEEPLAAIVQAIAKAPSPSVSGLVRCGDKGVVSPCDDGKIGDTHTRGCISPHQGEMRFDEYQGTISLPIFQAGKAPYIHPEDGGAIVLDGNGQVPVIRHEPVCFSLTVPKGTPPAAGWPLVVYSHGTGGSYRSAVTLGLAEDYAQGEATGGPAGPMATLTYEGVLHGSRKGSSTVSSDELVYNVLNPRAARDNALQAAADLLALPRALPILAAAGVKLDANRLALYGHSQGGNAAALAAAYEAGYGAVVLSGTGGTLVLSLMQKTAPINLPLMLPLLLGDAPVDANHPILSLLQMAFERSDPVNFARHLFREPVPGTRRRHVLHVYGSLDRYAPVKTQQSYAQAADFQVVLPLVDAYGLRSVPGPLWANEPFANLGPISAAQIQYKPDGYDGHFVSTQNSSARRAIQKMLVTFTREANPVIEP